MSDGQPRGLFDVVRDAELLLAGSEDYEEIEEILRELLAWVSTKPSPAEGAGDDYVALPVVATVQSGGVVQTNQGLALALQCVILVPWDNLRGSMLLGPDGKPPNPVEGLVPAIHARLCLPKKRVSPAALAAFGIVEDTPAKGVEDTPAKGVH